MNLLAGALVLATVVTVPIRVGVRIPNSVTISIPSVVSVPTPTPMPVSTPGTASGVPTPSPKPGASAAPAATPAPLTTQEIANDFAAQISKALSQTMSASQTKPLVTVELVLRPLTSSTATPSPTSGGDYVATINF